MPVSELAKSHGPSAWVRCGSVFQAEQQFVLRPLTMALVLWGWVSAWAIGPYPTQLPSGGQVVAGQATLSQTPSVLNILQSSQRAVIDWQTFNVGSAAQVNFNQPSRSSVTLNRVLDNNPSQIFGRITAPGQVYLVNPSGAYFAPSASVEVGSLIATTHNLSNEDFMTGRNTLVRHGASGSIVNEGQLRANLGGYIALLAPEVRNNGVVIAQVGTVVLAAGDAYTLQFDGAGLLSNVLVTPATMKALVENGNAVQAPGGLIILSAQAASRLQGGVVNNTGSLQANGVVKDGGRILLRASDQINHRGVIQADAVPNSDGHGGNITLIADLNNLQSLTMVSGSLSARAGEQGGNGGFVETSASHLHVSENAQVSTAAPKGLAGEWLLDPADVNITSSGSDSNFTPISNTYTPDSGVSNTTVSASTLIAALNSSTSVTITTTNSGTSGAGTGNITISSPIAKTGGNGITLTLNAAGSIAVNADLSSNSGAFNLTLNAGNSISGTGNLFLNNGTVTFNTAAGAGTYSGIISGGRSSVASGTGGVTKSGAGTLTLSGVNSYTGVTRISAGTLIVSNIGNGGVAGNMGQATSSASNWLLDGGTLQYSGATAATDRAFTLSTGKTSTIEVTAGSNLTISGASATTTGGLTKSGGGTLTLASASTFSGTTTVSSGTLVLSHSLALQNSTLSLGIGAGSLSFASLTTATLGALSGSGNLTLANDSNLAVALTVGQNNLSTAYLGVLSGAGSLIKAGSGMLTLSGANTYTGATTVNAGILKAGVASVSGTSGAFGKGSSVTLSNTSAVALDITGFNTEIGSLSGGGTNGGNVTLGAATLTVGDGNSTSFAGVISGTGGLTKQGAGTLTLSGTNTFTGLTTISAGTLATSGAEKLSDSTALVVASGATLTLGGNETIGSLADVSGSGGAVAVGSFTLATGDTNNTSFAGVISGAGGGLTKQGSGTMTLIGTNTYSGLTTINAGTLQIGSGGSTGTLGTGAVNNSASLIFNRNVATSITNTISGTGSVLAIIAGNLTLASGSSITSSGANIVLSTTGNFINNAGSGALSTTNGYRWIVYSSDPASNTFDGLSSGNKAYWGGDLRIACTRKRWLGESICFLRFGRYRDGHNSAN